MFTHVLKDLAISKSASQIMKRMLYSIIDKRFKYVQIQPQKFA